MRPQILIISRGGTRKLLNLEEVVAAAEELGFNVTVAEAGADVPVFTALVNAADVGRSRSRSSSGSSTARTSAPASTTPPLPSPPSRTSSSPGGRKSSHIALKVIFKSQLKQSQVEHQLRRQNTRSIPAVATMASASAAAQVVSFPPGRRAPLQPPRCTHSERGVSFDPGSAFYRSDSAPGRDLAVLAATLHRPRLPDPSAPFLCLDAMCGSGVRALRYLAQAGADFVWANDASDALHPVIVGNLPRLEPVPHLHRLAVHERLRRKMDCPIRATTYSACSFVDEVGRDRAHWWR
uniref:Predicted protein n=1 Tax=Hordeum vulgare subsp. vulgare TaxID=112509 RepID=F2DCZ9_HORVV|nr:predicted protein [Hordeum vulgare subsp. vulgare]